MSWPFAAISLHPDIKALWKAAAVGNSPGSWTSRAGEIMLASPWRPTGLQCTSCRRSWSSPLVALAIVSAWSPGESFAQQTTSASPDLSTANPTREDFARQIDIGGGRKMYLECRGTGSPTVVLVAGLKGSAEDWNVTRQSEASVFAEVAKFTRVCENDRPGTPVGEKPSRSDPGRQPTTAGEAVADLHALLGRWRGGAPRAGRALLWRPGRQALCAHISRDVSGRVRVDALTEGLRDAETPEQWAIQRKLMEGDIRESLVLYPALEGSTRTAASIRSAPRRRCAHSPWLSCPRIGLGTASPVHDCVRRVAADVPPDFGYITDAAQKQAQERLAKLVPNAKHVSNTNSGHEFTRSNPSL